MGVNSVRVSRGLLWSWFSTASMLVPPRLNLTQVFVAIGVGTCYVKVDDSGSGVSRDGPVLMGEIYATSKYSHSDDMHAFPASLVFKGEALSYISDVSLLEIVTKTHWRPNEYRKVLKDGKCLYLGIDDC
ncbi:DNA mismatch repair protein MLH3-like [Solanum dulcamara]|uniref:DNA mismatch repair protein MLH3-like n=1 Tax=Solanum dulcamara TaxID=45834 RepID=UPI002485FC9D|nr:DNA mismatch repair protein MLH3-like [Solanum dulcamara]